MMAGVGVASLIPWLSPRDLRHRRSCSTFFGHRHPASHAPLHAPQFSLLPTKYRRSGRHSPESLPDGENPSFDQAVLLFNGGDYHQCHDFLEELWYVAEEPVRTLLHGLLQCAVGFHHLFNQNHRGAMMELGEGLCKLRKMGFESGPFFRFEQEISTALEFIYQTQKELAACSDDLCLTMDGSDRSYQLLGSFAAGQRLYNLEIDQDGTTCIIFGQGHPYFSNKPLRVKLPTLDATEEHLKTCEYRC